MNSPTSQSFANHFLIAMPALADPNFERSVTWICEHNADGAMGIVINRPSDVSLGELYKHLALPISTRDTEQPVLVGGPVQTDRGFVVHRPGSVWISTWNVSDAASLTTSKDVLQAMAQGVGPRDAFIALGYAGWGAGQLEQELLDNAWLTVPADPRIIFDVPYEQRWNEAAKLIGIDISLLSGAAGHG
ncbi:MAG: YqgE/AlgH family protein [Pseudomonadota bacterium]